MRLIPFLPPGGTADPADLYDGFVAWAKASEGVSLYPH